MTEGRRPAVSLLAWIVIGLIAAAHATAQESAPASAAARVAALLDAPRLKNGAWGILVVDSRTGETLVAKDAEKLFCPASVTKLFSSAAMLDEFGAEHRFRTPVYVRERTNGKAKDTELILVASGDPNLSGRLTPEGKLLFRDVDHIYSLGSTSSVPLDCDPLTGLLDLARQVKNAGIDQVRDVLIDDRLFEAAQGSGSGPANVTPILVNDGVIDVIIEPGPAVDGPALVRLRPAIESVRLDVRVTTVAKGAPTAVGIERLGGDRFVVRGVVALDHAPFAQILVIEDPSQLARTLFIRALAASGVRVAASTLAAPDAKDLPSSADYGTLRRVAEHVSPPLIDALAICLKVSHNLHASLWPMLIAAKHGERTLDDGMRRIGDALKRFGVNVDEVSFTGAAGGMPGDMATPKETVALLRAVAARPDGAAFRAALPALGVDGTLAKAVDPSSPARGRVQAKTGTMGYDDRLDGTSIMRAKALAGYITTKSGRELTFAVFLNNVPARNGFDSAEAGRILGRVAEALWDGY